MALERKASGLLALALNASSVFGCEEASGPGVSGVPVLYKTTYASVAAREDNPHRICGGTLARIDRQIEFVSSRLGVQPELVEIYWYERAPTTGETVAYFDFASIVTDNGSLLHELVHAVAIPTIGTSQTFLTEDLAHAYEAGPTLLKDTRSPSENLDDDTRGSGHFSRWLIETKGEERYKMLFESPTPAHAQIRERFKTAYGAEIEDVEAEFFAEAPAWYPEVGLCDGLDEVRWDRRAQSLAVEVVSDCESMSSFGHTGNDAEPYAEVFQLVVPREFVGREFSSMNAFGRLVPCDIGEGPPGSRLDPRESETVDQFEGELGYDLQRPFIHRFKSETYRVELPFAADGEALSLELQLR